MTSIVAKPSPHSRQAPVRRMEVHLSGYLPAANILGWVLFVVGSLLLASRPIYVGGIKVDVTTPLQRQLQFASSIFIVFGILLGIGRARIALARATTHRSALLALYIAAALMIAFSLVRGSFLELSYVAALFGSLLLAAIAWTAPAPAMRMLSWGLPTICGLVVTIALLTHGLPRDRWVGGIHPNLMGFLLVIVGTYGIYRRSTIGMIVYLLAIALATMISSRYAMLYLTLLMILDGALYVYRRHGLLSTAPLLSLFPAAVVIFYSKISDVFLLQDTYRGVSSGASGRSALNAASIEGLSSHLLIGAGFRNRWEYVAAHNGFINFLNETGVFVFGLWMFVLMYATNIAIKEILKSSINQSAMHQRAIPALFLASLFSAIFQPQLINFGDAQGLALILGLGYLLTRTNYAR